MRRRGEGCISARGMGGPRQWEGKVRAASVEVGCVRWDTRHVMLALHVSIVQLCNSMYPRIRRERVC